MVNVKINHSDRVAFMIMGNIINEHLKYQHIFLNPFFSNSSEVSSCLGAAKKMMVVAWSFEKD